MRSLDRSWRLRLIPICLLSILGVVFGVWYAYRLFLSDVQGGVFGLSDLLLALTSLFAAFGVVAREVMKVALTRQHAQALRAAAEGQGDWLKVVHVPLDLEPKPGDSATITVLDAKLWRIWAGLGVVIVAALLAAVAALLTSLWLVYVLIALFRQHEPGWLVAFVRWSVSSGSQRGTDFMRHLRLASFAPYALLFIGTFAVAAFVWLYHALKAVATWQHSTEANAEGLSRRSVWRTRRVIRWQEASVLEVARAPIEQTQSHVPIEQTRLRRVEVPAVAYAFTLFDQATCITWFTPTTQDTRSNEIMALTRLVVAHTHLTPRSRDARLLGDGQSVTLLERVYAKSFIWLFFGTFALLAPLGIVALFTR